jgi:ferritin-like metal-binding protein YciE
MADIKDRLVDYVQDAHAMERNSLKMLESMLKTTDDPEMRQVIEHHRTETEQHIQRLEQRLKSMGKDTSTIRDTGALLGSTFKGLLDKVRSEKPSKNARDGYVTESVEVAAYELLCRLADRAGDAETASIARQNLQDEKAMIDKISGTWDKVIDLTIKEEQLTR